MNKIVNDSNESWALAAVDTVSGISSRTLGKPACKDAVDCRFDGNGVLLSFSDMEVNRKMGKKIVAWVLKICDTWPIWLKPGTPVFVTTPALRVMKAIF